MAYYPTTKLYIDNDGDLIAETDISNRVASVVEYDTGIKSFKDTERISPTGSLRFSLKNADGAYTDPLSLKGKYITFTVTYGGSEMPVWNGYIQSTKPDSGDWGQREVSVSASCWMSIANGTRVKDVPVSLDVTADEAIETLLDIVPTAPHNLDLDTGFETFPTSGDGAGKKTVVYSELNKIALSELGHLYLKHRGVNYGETLRFENYLRRSGAQPLSQFRTTPYEAAYTSTEGILWGTGSGSTGGKILIPAFAEATFDRTMVDSDWTTGENVVNEASVTISPRDEDASAIVLFTLDKPIFFGTNNKTLLTGGWADPDGGQTIAAFDVVTPVATTDYLAFANEDGTGSNHTASYVIKAFTYGANGWRLFIQNNGQTSWLTKLEIRGKGIYKRNPIEFESENTESKEEIVRNVFSQSITREYSNSKDTSKTWADGEIALNRAPVKVMKSATFCANTSEKLMYAFMYLEQGDKVRITESNPSHTGDYWIQGIKATISQGGVIFYTWYLKEAVETVCQPIALKAPDDPGTRVAVNFGILPYLANMTGFTYSAWVKRLDATSFGVILARTTDNGTGRRGNWLHVNTDGTLYFISYKTPDDGEWEAEFALPSEDVWYHVALTYDNSTDTADPKIYVNGSLVTTVEIEIPSGTSDDDADCPVMLFNIAPDPATLDEYFYDSVNDVVLKDIRIYNYILSPTEVSNLYTLSEDDHDYAQDGLMFAAPFAPSDNIDDYINDQILEQDWILDGIYRAAGIPYNETTTSSATTLYGLALT
jgi:hypothetical protein